jgi:hypothetical protein
MKISIRTILMTLLAAAIHTPGYAAKAESMTCKGGVVAIGDTIAEVGDKCGKPADSSHNERSYTAIDWKHNRKRTTVTIKVDNWTYHFAENKLMYLVTFENEKVVRINGINYGN